MQGTDKSAGMSPILVQELKTSRQLKSSEGKNEQDGSKLNRTKARGLLMALQLFLISQGQSKG